MEENSNNSRTEKNMLPNKNGSMRNYGGLHQKNRRLRKAWEKAQQTGDIYSHIAYALARGCIDLFYVNVDTGEFIEYRTDDERGMLLETRRGPDFFESCKRESKLFVHPEDQEAFLNAMNQDFLKNTLDRGGDFRMNYRRIKDGRTFYVLMKVSWMEDDDRFIVIAVFDIDELVMRRQAAERMEEERIVYARLHAITGNFLVVYVVDPETGHYREFSATDEYTAAMGLPKEGDDFFGTIRKTAAQFNHPEDVNLFLAAFNEENMLTEIKSNGIFTLGFRLMIGGRPRYVQMKSAIVEEKEGPRLIIGLNDIDVQVRQEERVKKRLVQAQSQANIDALTGVKNKHAYLEAEKRLDRQIAEHCNPPFAIVMMDMNDLKKINDTAGHQAGDQYIREACKIICDTFKHSPVFRIGGDEFTAIAQGSDYIHIENRLKEMDDHNTKALQTGGLVIACGMAKFENDTCAGAVFQRADQNMYENKNKLKLSSPDHKSEKNSL